MPRARRAWTDEDLDRVIGNLLRIGVMLAAGVVLIGGIIFLIRHGASAPDYRVFRSGPPEFRTVRGIVTGALSGRGRGFIQLGLLLLVATPVARVVFSVIGFTLQRDLKYVVITVIVLAVLIFSLAGGHL